MERTNNAMPEDCATSAEPPAAPQRGISFTISWNDDVPPTSVTSPVPVEDQLAPGEAPSIRNDGHGINENDMETGKDLEDVPIVIADVNSEQSLLEMAKQAHIVLNCVGPYRFYGEQVVRACIEGGAHHLDISGERQYLEKMQLLYDGKAREAGVYAIGACGWDSIPADMGTTFTRDNFDGDMNAVESYVDFHTGPKGAGGHFATLQTTIHGFANAHELIALRKQLFSVKVPKSKFRPPKRSPVFHSDVACGYCVPFPGSDRSVVNRTQTFNYSVRKERPLQFRAYLVTGTILKSLALIVYGIFFGIMVKFSFGRKLLESYPRLFTGGVFSHEGPTREQIAETSFTMTFLGFGHSSKLSTPEEQHTDKPDKKLVTQITGPEAGYIATPICITQAAYTLRSETRSGSNNLPLKGGVFTPGGLFAKTNLIDRLQAHKIKFAILDRF